MDLISIALWYSGAMFAGFVMTQFYDWYMSDEDKKQEDGLLISIACEEKHIRMVRLKNSPLETIDEMSSDSSDSDDISTYLVTNN